MTTRTESRELGKNDIVLSIAWIMRIARVGCLKSQLDVI